MLSSRSAGLMRRPHCGYATVAASAAARHGAGRQEGGLFGRIFGGKSTPAAQTDRSEPEQVAVEEEVEDVVDAGLPAEERLRAVAERHCGTQADDKWAEVVLEDPDIKFKVLVDVEKSFKSELPRGIPDNYLASLRTVGDVLQLVQSPPTRKRKLFPSIDFSSLPQNLHIQR